MLDFGLCIRFFEVGCFEGGFYFFFAEGLFKGFEGLGGLLVLGGELFVLLGEFIDAVAEVVGAHTFTEEALLEGVVAFL